MRSVHAFQSGRDEMAAKRFIVPCGVPQRVTLPDSRQALSSRLRTRRTSSLSQVR